MRNTDYLFLCIDVCVFLESRIIVFFERIYIILRILRILFTKCYGYFLTIFICAIFHSSFSSLFHTVSLQAQPATN